LEIMCVFLKFAAVALYTSFDDTHTVCQFLSTTQLQTRSIASHYAVCRIAPYRESVKDLSGIV
jgi:hypothetical protein